MNKAKKHNDLKKLQRKIIHVDMDAFYAAVEQRDDPRLRGRPVIVGGDPDGRGVVATCSYEARTAGVHSAMPAAVARRLCSDAVFLRPDFPRYVAVSREIRAIFRSYTPLVEPISLDEAYLDVTTERAGLPTATAVARDIRRRIAAELHLTASAGVGPCKLVAKIASDIHKPDGLTVVPPAAVRAFLEPLPVKRLWGVGPATAERLHAAGLRTVGQVAACAPDQLIAAVGATFGRELHRLARGEDDRAVVSHRPAKSHGAERTFAEDLFRRDDMVAVLAKLADEVASALAKGGRPGRTITIKVRYADFTTITRGRTMPAPVADARTLRETAVALLDKTEAARTPVRLLGVSVGNLVGEGEPLQLPLPLPLPGRDVSDPPSARPDPPE